MDDDNEEKDTPLVDDDPEEKDMEREGVCCVCGEHELGGL